MTIGGPWIVVLLSILVVLGLAGCGGQGGEGLAIPPTIMAESADVGESIRSDEWEVTLLELPHKDEIVGDESELGIQLATEYEVAAREAQGVWVVVPVRLTNVGEDNMILHKTIQIEDDQGRLILLGDRLAHRAEVTIANVERWGSPRENQLSQNVQSAGVSREGPLVFDIPDDSTGLRLVLKGADASLSLGF